MYREIEGEDVILEKDPTYTLTEDGVTHSLCPCLPSPPPLPASRPSFRVKLFRPTPIAFFCLPSSPPGLVLDNSLGSSPQKFTIKR